MGLPLFGAIAKTIGAIVGLVDEVTTTDEEKLDKQIKLDALASGLRVNLAKVEAEFAESQSRVVIAEAQSQSWLARNWRPITMMVFVGIIFYNHIAAPTFQLEYLPIIPDMWSLLKLGIGGYIGGRTVEKVAPKIVDAIRR